MTFKGFIKSVKKSLGVGSPQTVPLTATDSFLIPLLGNGYKFGTQSREFLTRAYGENPDVYMVVDRIAQRTIQLDRLLVRKSDNEEVLDIPEFELFLSRPNQKEDWQELLYRLYATYLVTGECFLVRVDTEDRVNYICPVNYNVIINQNTNGDVRDYRITFFGLSMVFTPSEVLHIHKPDITLDTNYGFSPLRAGRKVYESNNEVWASEAALHKNKGAAGVLGVKGSSRGLTPDDQDAIQKAFDRRAAGSENFGRTVVSGSELVWVQTGMSPTDLKTLETREEHLRKICNLYNVDSKLFGDTKANTYNNVENAERAMITKAVLPLFAKVNPPVIEFIAKGQSIETNNFDLTDITSIANIDTIQELSKPNLELSQKIVNEVNAGIISPQQAQAILYPELEFQPRPQQT